MPKLWNNWQLKDWLAYLENRHQKEVQLGLTRVASVARKAQLDKPKYKVITVAGTNGKGSTVTALEHIYTHSGYVVGSYTSPHLIQFNERIRINLNPISDEDLCSAFAFIETICEDIVLSYFEMTTLAALWYFQKNSPDIVILEVGLGGRLDATNIIDSDLSIITTIDYDHQEYLGTTLEAIGREKAGIVRSRKPFIYADGNPPQSIINKVEELQAEAYYYGRDYCIAEKGSSWSLSFRNNLELSLPRPSIQLKSASAACIASIVLNKSVPVKNEFLMEAMRSIFIPGRLQLRKGRVDALFDVAHNAQSVALLANTIKTLRDQNKYKKIHAIFSALKDKDLFTLIFLLKDCVDHWYPAQLDNKRAARSSVLLEQFEKAEIFGQICYNSPLAAFDAASTQASEDDLLVVYGSFYTVGYVLSAQSKINL